MSTIVEGWKGQTRSECTWTIPTAMGAVANQGLREQPPWVLKELRFKKKQKKKTTAD